MTFLQSHFDRIKAENEAAERDRRSPNAWPNNMYYWLAWAEIRAAIRQPQTDTEG